MASNTAQAEAPSEAGSRYRFDHLGMRLVLGDMYYKKNDPGPGDRVPDFDLPTLDGGRFQSSDLAERGPVLLVFGSYTCPVTDSAAAGIRELQGRFGDRVRFVIVNVREPHPGEKTPQPKEFDTKREHTALLRDLHGFDFEMATDDIDGTLHRALSPKPNSAYLLDSGGIILYRAQWANDTKAMAEALAAVTDGRPIRRTTSGGLVRPMWRMSRHLAAPFDRGGRSAWWDMWKVAPPIAATAALTRLLRLAY